METRTFVAEPNTIISTQVDPMGLETLIEFGENGKLTTSDPGLIAVLVSLARNPALSVSELVEDLAPRIKTLPVPDKEPEATS
jgi:hypothetical protein